MLREFVYSWYAWLSTDGDFTASLKWHLRFIMASLVTRLGRLDTMEVVSEIVFPALRDHFAACCAAHKLLPTKLRRAPLLAGSEALKAVERQVLAARRAHPGTASPAALTRYLRAMASAALPYLVAPDLAHCGMVSSMLREALVTYGLRPAVASLSDPDFLNVVMAAPSDVNFDPTPRSPMVDLLAAFAARATEGDEPHTFNTRSALRRRLPDVLAQQPLLHAFMRFLNRCSAIELLNFVLDAENYVKELTAAKADAAMNGTGPLNPEPWWKLAEKVVGLLVTVRQSSANNNVVTVKMVRDLKLVLQQQPRTKLPDMALFADVQGAVYSQLEKEFLPVFLHSDEFFTAILGARDVRAAGPPKSQAGAGAAANNGGSGNTTMSTSNNNNSNANAKAQPASSAPNNEAGKRSPRLARRREKSSDDSDGGKLPSPTSTSEEGGMPTVVVVEEKEKKRLFDRLRKKAADEPGETAMSATTVPVPGNRAKSGSTVSMADGRSLLNAGPRERQNTIVSLAPTTTLSSTPGASPIASEEPSPLGSPQPQRSRTASIVSTTSVASRAAPPIAGGAANAGAAPGKAGKTLKTLGTLPPAAPAQAGSGGGSKFSPPAATAAAAQLSQPLARQTSNTSQASQLQHPSHMPMGGLSSQSASRFSSTLSLNDAGANNNNNNHHVRSMDNSYHESEDDDDDEGSSPDDLSNMAVPEDALEGLRVRMKEPELRLEPREHYVYPIEIVFDPKSDTDKDKTGEPKPKNVGGGLSTSSLFQKPERGTFWEIAHRYSEFNALDRTLKSYYPDNLSLPRKKVLGNKDAELVEYRRKMLGQYLKALLENRLMQNDARCRQLIYWFLKDSKKFKALTRRQIALNLFKRAKKTLVGKSDTDTPDSSMEPFLATFAVTLHDIEEMTEEAFRTLKKAAPYPAVTYESDNKPAFPDTPEEAKQPIPLPGFTDRPLRANRSHDRVDDLLHLLWSIFGVMDGKAHPGLSAFLGTTRALVSQTVDDFLVRNLRYHLSRSLCEKAFLAHLETLYEVCFGPAVPPRTEQQKLDSFEAAKFAVRQMLPDVADNMSGHAMSKNIDMAWGFLQSPRLNEQLVLCLLDDLWLRLFPELIAH